MALAQHDRIDQKLTSLEFTGALCGSLNLRTGQAEYCGYDCPTLKARMARDEDPSVPINPGHAEPYRADLPMGG